MAPQNTTKNMLYIYSYKSVLYIYMYDSILILLKTILKNLEIYHFFSGTFRFAALGQTESPMNIADHREAR